MPRRFLSCVCLCDGRADRPLSLSSCTDDGCGERDAGAQGVFRELRLRRARIRRPPHQVASGHVAEHDELVRYRSLCPTSLGGSPTSLAAHALAASGSTLHRTSRRSTRPLLSPPRPLPSCDLCVAPGRFAVFALSPWRLFGLVFALSLPHRRQGEWAQATRSEPGERCGHAQS